MNNVQVMSRNELRGKILDLGWQKLQGQGGSALRVRDLAKGCGCSVGTVYNVFEGINEIVLRLNLRSLHMLSEMIMSALEKAQDLRSGVRGMGTAYMGFAKTHPHQWTTLFERESVEAPPKWYLDEVNQMLNGVEQELVEKFHLEQENAIKLVGFFWAAIHGITSIMLHKKTRIVERIIKEEDLDRYIDHCLMGMIP